VTSALWPSRTSELRRQFPDIHFAGNWGNTRFNSQHPVRLALAISLTRPRGIAHGGRTGFTVVVASIRPASDFSPTADELVAGNQRFADAFAPEGLEVSPTRQMAVVTCMDSRMDIFALLGLGNGEAHIIRNAGGVITDDVIRSLCLSQRKLGTREVVLVHHTDCGLQQVSEDSMRAEIARDIGIKPWWAFESFEDPYVDVRQSMKRLQLTPFIPYKDNVRGFVYEVTTGLLREVLLDDD